MEGEVESEGAEDPGVPGVVGVFTDPQFQVTLREFMARKGTEVIAARSVVTDSGQRVEIEIKPEAGQRVIPSFDVDPVIDSDGRAVSLNVRFGSKDSARKLSTSVAVFAGQTIQFDLGNEGEARHYVFLTANIVTMDGNAIAIPPRESVLHPKPRISSVVLDAGHGGLDRGGKANGLTESDLNLMLVRKTRLELEERGITVHLTRKNDQFLSLSDRVNIANAMKDVLFVSLHHNSAADSELRGFEVWYPALNSDATNERLMEYGRQLAGNLQSSLANEVGTRLPDRGIRDAKYMVLQNCHPSVRYR